MTVRALIQAYRHANTTRSREEALHARWWNQALGEEAVAALTPALLLAQLDRLASYGRAPSTVMFFLRFLRRVTAWGTRAGHLPTDPCAGLPLPKARKPIVRVLTSEEEARLCAALGQPYARWMGFALETGLKLSEQFSLRWREVDLDRGQILLPASTGTAVFHVLLSPIAVSLLRTLRQSQPPSMWVFPDLKTPSRPVNVHSFLSWRWGRGVHEAGIPWLTWKDLRTTCGVRLTEQGYSVEDVVARMRPAGHKRAYLYRCTAEKRPPKVIPEAAPSMYQPLVSGELSAVIGRDLRAQPVTFDEAARLYAVHHLGQRDSRRQFECIVRQFWPRWKECSLEGLTRREVKVWYREQSHIPGYANKALNNLRAMINWALDLELITCANPHSASSGFPPFHANGFYRPKNYNA